MCVREIFFPLKECCGCEISGSLDCIILALDVAMKHMMQKCPFLIKNPGLMATNTEVLHRLAARCPVMAPVVNARDGK
jgi:hypothetical protein